jgi:hypothetical protein
MYEKRLKFDVNASITLFCQILIEMLVSSVVNKIGMHNNILDIKKIID